MRSADWTVCIIALCSIGACGREPPAASALEPTEGSEYVQEPLGEEDPLHPFDSHSNYPASDHSEYPAGDAEPMGGMGGIGGTGARGGTGGMGARGGMGGIGGTGGTGGTPLPRGVIE
jgi:hypothetical protein